MIIHDQNPRTFGSRGRRFLPSLRPIWSAKQVPSHPGYIVRPCSWFERK